MNEKDVPLIALCYQVISVVTYDYVKQDTYNRDILMVLTGSKLILEDLVDSLMEQKYLKEGEIQPIHIQYLIDRISAIPMKNQN